jgi:hypothetical protein
LGRKQAVGSRLCDAAEAHYISRSELAQREIINRKKCREQDLTILAGRRWWQAFASIGAAAWRPNFVARTGDAIATKSKWRAVANSLATR